MNIWWGKYKSVINMAKKRGVPISTSITRAQEEMIDVLIKEGRIANRSEFIRAAIEDRIDKELSKMKRKT